MTNAAKYAKATRVQVRLYAEHGVAHVCVRDDGVGFDTDTPRNRAHGLLGMRYRLESEGGHLALTSRPGAGTAIEASIPESVETPQPETAAA